MSDYQRVILVSGANTGMGFEIAKSLAEKGHIVYIGARNETAGKEAQRKLVSEGHDNVKFVQLEIDVLESVIAAKDLIEKAEGRLDSLVNNAGVGVMEKSGGALNESIANIQEGLNTNLFGLINVCQVFVPLMRRSSPGYACIVTVTTDMASNGLMASPKGFLHNFIAYNTSKVAANSYTIALAKELEGEIKVNLVTPGFTTTRLNGFKPGGKTPRQAADLIVPWALLGPEDKDKTCLFLGDNGPFPW